MDVFDYDNKSPLREKFIAKTEFVTFKPMQAADPESRVFTFDMDSSELYMYDLQNATVSALLSIQHRQRGKIGKFRKTEGAKTYDPVTFSNLMLDTMFEKVVVSLNDQQATITEFAQFRSFFEKALSYSSVAKDSTIVSQFFIRDAVDSLSYKKSSAMISKSVSTENSQELYISTKLSNDLFNVVQYLPGTVKISVTLHRSADAFSLLIDDTGLTDDELDSAGKYYVKINNLQLSCKRIMLTNEGQHFLTNRVQRPLHFVFPSLDVNTVMLPGSVRSWETVLPITRLPERIFVGLIDTSALYGDYRINSLFFKNYTLTELALKRDNTTVDSVSIDKWDYNNAIPVYNKLLYLLKITNTQSSIDITPQSFTDGPYSIIPLLASNDISGLYAYPTAKIALSFKFKKPTPTNGITAVVFSNTISEMIIDRGQVRVENVISY